MRGKKGNREGQRMVKKNKTEDSEKTWEEMDGRGKGVACEKETVSGRDRNKETVGMREMLDL